MRAPETFDERRVATFVHEYPGHDLETIARGLAMSRVQAVYAMTDAIGLDRLHLFTLSGLAGVLGVERHSIPKLYPEVMQYRSESGRFRIPAHRVEAWQTARDKSVVPVDGWVAGLARAAGADSSRAATQPSAGVIGTEKAR